MEGSLPGGTGNLTDLRIMCLKLSHMSSAPNGHLNELRKNERSRSGAYSEGIRGIDDPA